MVRKTVARHRKKDEEQRERERRRETKKEGEEDKTWKFQGSRRLSTKAVREAQQCKVQLEREANVRETLLKRSKEMGERTGQPTESGKRSAW